ncbi:MAG: hypothetical protein C5S52_03155 [ANME-2 cluster archaeon]|nr:hypothetical protein [ANME-2 cluster archaeon]
MSFREIESPMDSILNRNKEYGGGRPMKDKEFDAVRMMREIRDELSRRYNEDPSAERRGLQEIRKKYGIKDGVYLIPFPGFQI